MMKQVFLIICENKCLQKNYLLFDMSMQFFSEVAVVEIRVLSSLAGFFR